MFAETAHIDWQAADSSIPSFQWMSMFWTFLTDEYHRILAKQTETVDQEDLAKVR